MDVVTEYVRLGLRFGRLVEGYVDCFTGDPALAARVADEPEPHPADLARQAGELLRATAGSDLAPHRQRFLAGQLRALVCAGNRLAGGRTPFMSEVREYFDVDIELTDTDRFAALHDELGALLPGPGPLHERVTAFRDRDRIPPDRLAEAVIAVSDALRERLGGLLRLPAGEAVRYQVVTDEPWNAFNTYLGGSKSLVRLNADTGHRMTALPFVATHEAYPGHHSEHCLKETGLVLGAGEPEHVIALVNTPQSLMAEGTAEMALWAALGDDWGAWTEQVLGDAGLRFDGGLAQRVEQVTWQLLAARQDAAILLHDRGRDPAEVAAYLERWMLVTPQGAQQMLRFLSHPLWRAYTVTYIAGKQLVGRWLRQGPDVAARHRRLLAEPLLPGDLRAGPAADPEEAPKWRNDDPARPPAPVATGGQ